LVSLRPSARHEHLSLRVSTHAAWFLSPHPRPGRSCRRLTPGQGEHSVLAPPPQPLSDNRLGGAARMRAAAQRQGESSTPTRPSDSFRTAGLPVCFTAAATAGATNPLATMCGTHLWCRGLPSSSTSHNRLPEKSCRQETRWRGRIGRPGAPLSSPHQGQTIAACKVRSSGPGKVAVRRILRPAMLRSICELARRGGATSGGVGKGGRAVPPR